MSNFQEIITNGTYHEDGNIQTAEIAVIDALTFATGKNPRSIDLDRIGNLHSFVPKDGVYCFNCSEEERSQAIINFDFESPEKKITAGNSSHKIQSGEIITGGSKEKRHLQVAVKPSNSLRRCLIQIANMQRMEQEGFRVFKILYMIVKDGNPYLVTESEMDIIPMDTYNFQETERERVLFHGIGRILARMHSKRITHGDAQIKNFVFDNGRIRVIDFEKTTFHEWKNGRFYKDANNDFQAIIQSIQKSKSLSPVNWRVYINDLFQGYIDHLTELYVTDTGNITKQEILNLIEIVETNYLQSYHYQKTLQLHQQSVQEEV